MANREHSPGSSAKGTPDALAPDGLREVIAARLGGVAGAIEAAIDRHGLFFVTGMVALVVGRAMIQAEHRPLWNDELFTYYIAQLPDIGDVWSELESGVEQLPPLFYVITRAFLEVFGISESSIRLPAILGFAIASICLYLFVARRTSALYGLIAAAFPLVTTADYFASEARPYGLVLAFAALALLFWQLASEGGPHRHAFAIGIGLSLAAAVSSHYYAILVLVPLSLGELARTWARGRLDWLIWAAFSVGLLPFLVFLPLLQGAAEYTETFWAPARWSSVASFYPHLLTRTSGVIVVALIVALVVVAVRRWPHGFAGTESRLRRLSAHELVAGAGLLLIPLAGVLLGKLVTGAFTGRYALPAVLGVAVMVALAACWIDRRTPIMGVTLLCLLMAGAFTRSVHQYGVATTEADERQRAFRYLEQQNDRGLPIVVSDPHLYFELRHYGAEGDGSSLVYIADAAKARERVDTDVVDRGLIDLEDVAPLQVESFEEFVGSTPRFLVYGDAAGWDWLLPELTAKGSGFRVRVADDALSRTLYEVAPRTGSRPHRD